MIKNKLLAVSLFSGAGIGDVGFEAAGLSFIVMVEKEPDRASLAKNNFPEAEIFIDDIWKSANEITGEDCYNFINTSLFNPKVRGFQLLNYDRNFKIENKKQFWTEGPCLLIKGKLA